MSLYVFPVCMIECLLFILLSVICYGDLVFVCCVDVLFLNVVYALRLCSF